MQKWELVDSAPGYTPGKHESYSDIDIFDVGTTSGVSLSSANTLIRKTAQSITSPLDLLDSLSAKKISVHMLSSLVSRKTSPYFFQIGDQITPIE